jgi:DNA-directed RNA polymerase specialized sigma24 family protein
VLYEEHRHLLLYIAGGKFNVPEEDCESLLHDVLLSYMQSASCVEKPRAWLVAAMCNASRGYWTRSLRTDRIEGTPLEVLDEAAAPSEIDRIDAALCVRRVLSYLDRGDRMVLRLRFNERLRARDVAARLGTTTGYAEKLIFNAVHRAREIFNTLQTQQHPVEGQTNRRRLPSFRLPDD